MTYPVLGDISTGEVLEPASPILGAVCHGHLHELVSRFVRPVVAEHSGAAGA